jgi:hypothetical protein
MEKKEKKAWNISKWNMGGQKLECGHELRWLRKTTRGFMCVKCKEDGQ